MPAVLVVRRRQLCHLPPSLATPPDGSGGLRMAADDKDDGCGWRGCRRTKRMAVADDDEDGERRWLRRTPMTVAVNDEDGGGRQRRRRRTTAADNERQRRTVTNNCGRWGQWDNGDGQQGWRRRQTRNHFPVLLDDARWLQVVSMVPDGFGWFLVSPWCGVLFRFTEKLLCGK